MKKSLLLTAILIIVSLLGILSIKPILTGKVTQEECNFLRGDSNSDSSLNLADPMYILNFLFKGGNSPICEDSADSNDDGRIDITDAVFILQYLFSGGGSPPLPFPSNGIDPTSDSLSCGTSNACSYKKVNLCPSLGIQDSEECLIQVFAQSKIIEKEIDSDLSACAIIKSGKNFIGCDPYESANSKEHVLVRSFAEQRNPSFYNSDQGLLVTWEEFEKNQVQEEKIKIYLCRMNGFIADPYNYCELNKKLIAYGSHPSVSRYLVWKDENSIRACDPFLEEGKYSCTFESEKMLITEEINSEGEYITPLIKENNLLYRKKVMGLEKSVYYLYACIIGQDNFICPSKSIAEGQIDLSQAGDIKDGRIVYASKNNNQKYDIVFLENPDKKIIIAEEQELVSSPQLVSLYNNELKQMQYYVVWKQSNSGNKYNIQVKLADGNLNTHYKVITPGYTGANGPSVFDQRDFTFIQDKILGKFEGSFDESSDQNFLNKWFTCNLKSLENPSQEELDSGLIGGCLQRV
ncbi:MAG: dockerin type I repeat-containing protein [Nanoarchaeota archaeon]|nr:dockerin type I repeat-containing protein [Nanoarchaeota archaeon]